MAPTRTRAGIRRTTCTRRSTTDLQTKAPAAFAFLSAMQWTNDDQNVVGLGIHEGDDPAVAAQKWIDENPQVWQPWVDAGLAAQS